MKKLLILMLVLGLVSVANASITFQSATVLLPCNHGVGAQWDVAPGQNITVQVVSLDTIANTYTLSITETITDPTAGYATATGLGTLNALFDMAPIVNGTLRNGMTTTPSTATQRYMLIDKISGAVTAGHQKVPIGQALYTFEIHIPAAAVYCDKFTITAAIGTPNFGGAGYTHNLNGVAQGVVPPGCNALVLHVVPEPATIALLGLGGLLLRRRK